MAVVAILAEWMAFVRALAVAADAPAAVAEDVQGHVENQIRLGLSVTVCVSFCFFDGRQDDYADDSIMFSI